MTSVEGFAEASAVQAAGAVDDVERFRAEVPDGWQQGRGAFGGLALGIAVRAMEASASEDPSSGERPMRALTGELPGPLVVGPVDVRVTTLRRGSGLSTLEAHLVQEGEVKARASGLFGARRDDTRAWAPAPPAIGAYDDATEVPSGALPPPFARHYEYRPTGPLPFSGGDEARAEGWIRTRAPLERVGPAELVGLVDAYWPAVFAIERAPRPMATVSFTLSLFDAATRLDPTRPLYYRARAVAASDGFVAEHRELWTPEGELVALNPQTFVVIR